jgi:tetratricopeptide (TPR) repeat protein
LAAIFLAALTGAPLRGQLVLPDQEDEDASGTLNLDFSNPTNDDGPTGLQPTEGTDSGTAQIPEAPPEPVKPEIRALLSNARDATRAQRFDDAEAILEQVLDEDPENLEALSQLAFVHEQRAGLAMPEDDADPDQMREYTQHMDEAAEVYLRGAEVAMEQEDYRTAELMYDRILSYSPSNQEGLLGIARVFAETGRHMQAVEKYGDYLSLDSPAEKPTALIEQAESYIEVQLWRQAIRALRDPVVNSIDPEVNALLARALLGLGRVTGPGGALDTMRTAVRSAPEDPEYHSRLALLLTRANQPNQALEAARQSIQLAKRKLAADPSDQDVLQQVQGYYQVYRQILGTVLRENQADSALRVELAQAMQRQADITQLLSLHQALATLEAAPNEAQDSVTLLEEKAAIQYQIKDPEAMETCRRIIERDPDNELAQQILASGQHSSAAP